MTADSSWKRYSISHLSHGNANKLCLAKLFIVIQTKCSTAEVFTENESSKMEQETKTF